jgi:hypothetical protein
MSLTKQDAHRIAAALKPQVHAFIDGAFAPAADGATFDTVNPATGAVIARVAHCGRADVDRAVAAARRVFDDGTWSRRAPEARKEVLIRLANLVRQNAQELAVLESLAQRVALRGAYRAAGFVSRTGVRVDHRNPEEGALGVGRMPMEDVARRFGAEWGIPN